MMWTVTPGWTQTAWEEQREVERRQEKERESEAPAARAEDRQVSGSNETR